MVSKFVSPKRHNSGKTQWTIQSFMLQRSHIMIVNSTKFGGNRTKDLEVGSDRHTDSYIPPNYVFGGHNKEGNENVNKGGNENENKGWNENDNKGRNVNDNKGGNENDNKGGNDNDNKGVMKTIAKGVMKTTTKGVLKTKTKGVMKTITKGVLKTMTKAEMKAIIKGVQGMKTITKGEMKSHQSKDRQNNEHKETMVWVKTLHRKQDWTTPTSIKSSLNLRYSER